MAQTDILLDDDSIDAVPNTGEFNLRTALNDDPDIRLSPDTAALDLGGGDGDTSFGNATLYTDDGDAHIQLATGRTVPADKSDAAVFAGSDEAGRLLLGHVGESDPRVTLDGDASQAWLGNDADSGRLTVYRGGSNVPQVGTVTLDGDDAAVRAGGGLPNKDAGEGGEVSVQNSENDSVVAASAGDDGGGRVALQNGFSQETVDIEGGGVGRSGTLTLSNFDGDDRISLVSTTNTHGSKLALFSQTDTETVAVHGDPPNGDGGRIDLTSEGSASDVSAQAEGGSGGGAVTVDNDAGATTGDLDGGTGELSLGASGSTDATSEGGALRLDDGDGNEFVLEVEDGTLNFGFPGSGGDVGFELEPSEGQFRVVDGDGTPVFRVDTQDESVEFAKGYSRGTIGSGGPGKGGGRGGP